MKGTYPMSKLLWMISNDKNVIIPIYENGDGTRAKDLLTGKVYDKDKNARFTFEYYPDLNKDYNLSLLMHTNNDVILSLNDKYKKSYESFLDDEGFSYENVNTLVVNKSKLVSFVKTLKKQYEKSVQLDRKLQAKKEKENKDIEDTLNF